MIRTLIAAALVLLVPLARAQDRPNILFIFTDDHGAQAISAYGSNRNTTPNIDRIAAEGMRFDNCFVTNAICGPSRAVILTGLHSHRNGFRQNGDQFDGSQRTFPKLLQQAGYQTAMIGKWHLGTDPTGFDYWDILIGQGPYYNPPMIRNGERIEREGYTTDIITDLTIDWLEGRDPDKPFFLACQHKAPHRNWQPGPDHINDFDNVQIPEPATLFDDWSGRGPAAAEQEMTVAHHLSDFDLKLTAPGNLTPEQLAIWENAYGPKNEAFRAANLTGADRVRWMYQRYVKDYLRCVASVDDGIGRLLETLDDLGLAQNTVVIYSSDQGWYLGEHGWYDKRWMYEESFRMPLLVRWPGVIRPGSVDEHLVQNLDFAETFLDLAGVEVPDDMQGRSLAPLFKGEDPDWRDAVYYHYYEHPGVHNVQRHYGVRTDRYKLIHFYRAGYWELFDLERDPDELTSVYDDPAYADVVEELKAELQRLRAQYGVPDDD
ncbi:MAG: sulfatase [Phycisphaerales bacterium JB039]